jgi:hypothetical protein
MKAPTPYLKDLDFSENALTEKEGQGLMLLLLRAAGGRPLPDELERQFNALEKHPSRSRRT